MHMQRAELMHAETELIFSWDGVVPNLNNQVHGTRYILVWFSHAQCI